MSVITPFGDLIIYNSIFILLPLEESSFGTIGATNNNIRIIKLYYRGGEFIIISHHLFVTVIKLFQTHA